jgi:hypothetical protein
MLQKVALVELVFLLGSVVIGGRKSGEPGGRPAESGTGARIQVGSYSANDRYRARHGCGRVGFE